MLTSRPATYWTSDFANAGVCAMALAGKASRVSAAKARPKPRTARTACRPSSFTTIERIMAVATRRRVNRHSIGSAAHVAHRHFIQRSALALRDVARRNDGADNQMEQYRCDHELSSGKTCRYDRDSDRGVTGSGSQSQHRTILLDWAAENM